MSHLVRLLVMSEPSQADSLSDVRLHARVRRRGARGAGRDAEPAHRAA